MSPHDYLDKADFVRYADGCKADNTALAGRVGELEVGMGEVKTEMKTFLDIAKDTNANTRWLALEILLAAILVPVVQHFLGK